MKPNFRILKWVALALILACSKVKLAALCSSALEAGTWRNTNPATISISRVMVYQSCYDTGPIRRPLPAPFSIRLFGKCGSGECDMGWVDAQVVRRGGREYLHAEYRQGYATRQVYIQRLHSMVEPMFVSVYTDFADPRRRDSISADFFRPE